ncbi:MAG: HIT domain-containing protein, partial [Desulfomonilaceae bacterium]
MNVRSDCIFCKIVAGDIPCTKVFEDSRVLSFMDICPLNKGHLLVIPKEHFETILDIPPELYGHMASVVCRIARAVQDALA